MELSTMTKEQIALELRNYTRVNNLDESERVQALLAELLRRLDAPAGRFGELRDALQRLYDETAEYIRINNLGDVHHNRAMQMARDALASPRPASQPRCQEIDPGNEHFQCELRSGHDGNLHLSGMYAWRTEVPTRERGEA